MLDLAALRRLSASLGQDLNLVQAGGGNTSIKQDGTLWIKASGKWLINAGQEDIFLPVPLALSLKCIDEGHDCTDEFPTAAGESLRPSVETTMHAVMPHRVVIHVHSVNTIAWAVRQDAIDRLSPRLTGLRWEWIPYIHPGFPLARRIKALLSSRPDVLVLGNHGLVVGGDDYESAEALVREVEHRLDIALPAPLDPDLGELEELASGGWKVAPSAEVHTLGKHSRCCEIAAGGTMYPDHCVYLGPAAAIVREGEAICGAIADYQSRYQFDPVFLLVAGKGVLVSERMNRAGAELLVCLKRVTERIAPKAQIHYLDDRQVAQLMNWDAEKYRISLARRQDQPASL